MKPFAFYHTSIILVGLIFFSCQKPNKPTDKMVRNSSTTNNDIDEKRDKQEEGILDKISQEDIACSESNDPGPSPLLRLTPEQYKNSVKEIFDEVSELDKILPNPNRREIGSALGSPSLLEVSQYAEASTIVADSVVEKLQNYAPCQNSTTLEWQRSCLSRFLDEYGILIFRSPLSQDDKNRLDTVFQEGAKTSYEQGMHLVIQALFESPRFIYRIEHGSENQKSGSYVAVNDYELASRLSFVLWNQSPDRTLIESIQSGTFSTDTGYQKQVDRLLQDQRADTEFISFARSWLGLQSELDKDIDVFPGWSEQVLNAMNAQADDYLEAILLESKYNVDSFFQHSHEEYAPEGLKQWYDDTKESAGVLSLPLLLSNHSKAYETFPIARGMFMLEKILCIQLPDPPADVGELPAFSDFANNRERLAAHTSNPECQGCHKLIDPLGFAFENYDAIGQFRLREKSQVIDASGELTGIDISGTFSNLTDLAKKLSTSQDVKQCITRHWFRYAMQRREVSADGCSLSKMLSSFSTSNYKFTELRKSILTTPAFTHRRLLEDGEGSINEPQDPTEPQDPIEPQDQESLVMNRNFNNGSQQWDLTGQGIIKLNDEDNFVFSPQSNEARIIQTLQLEPNTDYEISIRINALQGASGPMVLDTSDRFDDTAQIVQRTSTNGWQEFKASFNSRAFDEVLIRVFVEDDFTGTVYFDDVQVKKK